jgi:hypothetical protein
MWEQVSQVTYQVASEGHQVPCKNKKSPISSNCLALLGWDF